MCDNPLILAAKNGNHKEVLSLLEQGFSLQIRDKDNATPLYWSCCRGYPDISKILIEHGCEVNARVTWGSTALHAACDRGHVECVKILIRSGADINVQNRRGDTPLHLSSYRGYLEIVIILQKVHAKLDIKNEKGRTAAEEAQGNEHPNIANLLKKAMNSGKRSSPILDLLNNGQGRLDMNNSYTQGQSLENIYGGNMESLKTTPTSGVSSNDFVRYNSNMSGFCQRTVPQEHTDDVFENSSSSPKKDNKLCRRESINGCERNGDYASGNGRKIGIANSAFDQKSQGQGSNRTQIWTSNSRDPVLSSITGQYNRSQNDNSDEYDMSNGHSGVSGGIDVKTVKQQASRVQRSSISCLQEISDHKHEELVAGFAETLQVELLKKQDELDCKENDVKALKSKLQKAQLQIQQLLFVKFHDQRLYPNSFNSSPYTDSKSSVRSDTDYRYCLSHLGFLSLFKGSDNNSAIWNQSEHSIVALKNKIKEHWFKEISFAPLDVANREWTPGNDFVLIGDGPINQISEGQRDGSCSLVFQIKHGRHMLILKMMINLINMVYNRHGDGYSLGSYLTKNFGPEYDIPCKLKAHPNIVTILHYYDGSTERFRKFLSLVIPNKFDVPIEMASRTTFLVMKKYPETLKSLMVLQRTKLPEPNYGLSSMFIYQVLYQILSAVYHLQRNGVVHRDIKADNILLDENLRPVLSDFGMARRLHGSDGKPLKFSNPCQACAGNPHAWAPELSRFNRSSVDNSEILLEEIYSKSDAYAVSRMFYSILRPLSDGDQFPQSSVNRPHYNDSDIPELSSIFPTGLRYILHQLVLDNPVDRITVRKAMLSVGMLMYPPPPGEITMETETTAYCQAQMFKLLAVDSKQSYHVENSSRIEASVRHLMPILEVDFLYNITPEEFWEIYSGLKQRQLL